MTRRRLYLMLALAILLFPSVVLPADCPACGAPLDPGARFCTQCGRRLETATPAAPAATPEGGGPTASVVQAIASHDRLLTSAFGTLMYGEKIEIPSMLGNAFAVAPGEFVTDASLLVGARSLTLRTGGGRTVEGRILGIDQLIGVGLVAADLPGITTIPLRLASPPRLGEAVTARGYSADRSSRQGDLASLTGVLSGLHRGGLRLHPVEDYVQTDATLPFGFAGAPLVDGSGAAVGMCTGYPVGRLVMMGPAGLGFAVPAAWVDRAVRWVRSGSPTRAWLGLHIAAADDEIRRRHGLPAEIAWVVEDVFPDSPAASAGARRGDGVVGRDGRPIATLLEIQEALLDAQPGDRWALDLVSGRQPRTIQVTLGPRPPRPRLTPRDTLRYFGGFELTPRADSLVVERVHPHSPAAAARIVAGDLLQSVMSAKDLDRPERFTARWRAVKDVDDLDRLVLLGYSDFDFYIGVGFKAKDGQKKKVFLGDVLTPLTAL